MSGEKRDFRGTVPIVPIFLSANTNQAIVIFPYNQKNLFVPDDAFWTEIENNMKNSVLICSPNALVQAKPKHRNYLVTNNENVFWYWKEIRHHIVWRIEKIKVFCSDINVERIKRDFALVWGNDFAELTMQILPVPAGFWKTFYKFREKIVLSLPIRLYKFLGKLGKISQKNQDLKRSRKEGKNV